MSDFVPTGQTRPKRVFRDGEFRPYESAEYSMAEFSKDDEILIQAQRTCINDANERLTAAGVPAGLPLGDRIQMIIDISQFVQETDLTLTEELAK